MMQYIHMKLAMNIYSFFYKWPNTPQLVMERASKNLQCAKLLLTLAALSCIQQLRAARRKNQNKGESLITTWVVAHSVMIAAPSHTCPPLFRGKHLHIKFKAFSSVKVKKFQYA